MRERALWARRGTPAIGPARGQGRALPLVSAAGFAPRRVLLRMTGPGQGGARRPRRSGSVAGTERRVAVGSQQAGGRFGVGDAHAADALEVEARDRGERAGAGAGKVRRPLALEGATGDPDRRLVRDDERLPAGTRRPGGVGEGRRHAPRDVGEGLPPARPQRVEHHRPVAGPPQGGVMPAEDLSDEAVAGLGEALVGDDLEPGPGGGEGLDGLDRPLEGARAQMGERHVDEGLGDGPRHRQAVGRQPEPGQPLVQDAVGVVHLAVPHHVDDGPLTHGCSSDPLGRRRGGVV